MNALVDLFCVDLNKGDLDAARGVLSADELERGGRLLDPREQARFVRAHAALRRILGELTELAPESLRFVYGPDGKPSLPHGPGFSLAHTGDFALLAVAARLELGVDLERRDRSVPPEVVRRLSPLEQRELERLGPVSRQLALLRTWVRKEAFLKAAGDGLARALDSFDVTVAPGEPARLIATRPDAREVERYTLADLPAPEGYLAAIAIRVPLGMRARAVEVPAPFAQE